MKTRATIVVAAAIGIASVLACSGTSEQGAATGLDAGSEGHGHAAGNCSEAEMAAILAAANQAQVDATMQLRANLSDLRTLDLAEKMLTDHALLLEQLQGATRDDHVSARDDGISRAITASAAQDRVYVAASGGIDAAYVEREVLWHVRDQGLLAQLVAPGIRGTRLASVATSMQEIEKQHVALALALQAALDDTCR